MRAAGQHLNSRLLKAFLRLGVKSQTARCPRTDDNDLRVGFEHRLDRVGEQPPTARLPGFHRRIGKDHDIGVVLTAVDWNSAEGKVTDHLLMLLHDAALELLKTLVGIINQP